MLYSQECDVESDVIKGMELTMFFVVLCLFKYLKTSFHASEAAFYFTKNEIGGNGMIALVLDGDPKMLGFWEDRIHGWIFGAEVILCKTKEEAWIRSMLNEVDVFIVELMLNEDDRYHLSGLDFLVEIRRTKRYKYTPTIICTKIDDQKFFSYPKLHCFQYMEKPPREEALLECSDYLRYIDYIKRHFNDMEHIICIRNHRGFFCIDEREIIRMEIHKNYAILVSEDETLEVDVRLANSIKLELVKYGWIQCNRSDYVNRRYIMTYYRGFITLKKGGGNIQVTDLGKKELFQRMESEKRNLE